MRPIAEWGSRELHVPGHHTSVHWTQRELTLTVRSAPRPGSAAYAREQMMSAARGRPGVRTQMEGPLRLQRTSQADMLRAAQVLERTGVLRASPRGDRETLAWLLTARLPAGQRHICRALHTEITALNAAELKTTPPTPAHPNPAGQTQHSGPEEPTPQTHDQTPQTDPHTGGTP